MPSYCWPCSSSPQSEGEEEEELHRPLIPSEPLRPFSCAGHPTSRARGENEEEEEDGVCHHTFDEVFILQDQIGKGSTATCYKCLHRKSGAVLSVKVIDKRRVKMNYSDLLLEQFRLEAKILRSLSHPNIIKLFECFESEQSLHVVTEYVAEGELFDYLVERPDRLLSEAEASGIVRQIAHALAYLHREGVVHRDIKLENILVSRRPLEEDGELFPQVKLIDFGLAKKIEVGDTSVLSGNNRRELTAHTYFGTLGYIAPEMNTKRVYNQAVDVWALGVLTYVLLCGVFPFEGDTKNISSIKYPPWAQSISASAKDLVEKLLCVDPIKRLSASRTCAHEWVAGSTASRLALLGTPQLLESLRLGNQYGQKDLKPRVWESRLTGGGGSGGGGGNEEAFGAVSPLSLDRIDRHHLRTLD
ncbi:hypothetical protein BASA82_000219 [Batrachochytrium salamandrivorans]|nr:hypothetical protein BASA82_000219 [Batrachochytrium salamandrivorans]